MFYFSLTAKPSFPEFLIRWHLQKCVDYKNVNERFINAFHSVISYANSHVLQKSACNLAESAK